MRKHLLLFFLLLICSNFTSKAQITFEKAYFINNSGQKVECLIKNTDWHNTPTQITYKLSEDDEPRTATIETVQEFNIYNSAKYVRSTVDIDKSSESFYHLSSSRQPVFEEKEIFLKVLIEGKASLYEYTDDVTKFFYRKDDSDIEQLIFKSYKTSEGQVFQNKMFQQQLWTDLNCSTVKRDRIQNLELKKSSLRNLFADYNECQNSEYKSYEVKQKQDFFALSIRPRLNYSSLTVENPLILVSGKTNFANKFNFGLGLEAEFTLPFHKNKWAIIIEPTYQQYKAEKTTETRPEHGRTQIAQVDYKSIELPIGIRHNFFLNQNSRIFINASYLFDMNFDSSIVFTRENGHSMGSLEIQRRANLALGMGYKFQNYNLELRYQPDRRYKTASVILGYSFI